MTLQHNQYKALVEALLPEDLFILFDLTKGVFKNPVCSDGLGR